jgi:hypothetical protein
MYDLINDFTAAFMLLANDKGPSSIAFFVLIFSKYKMR